MPKVNSAAKWFGLSPQQRATVEHWLFDDGLSYDKVLERAQKEFSFTGSRSSLRRFYAQRENERTLLDLARSANSAQAVAQAPADPEVLRDAGLKVAAQIFFHQVTENPDDLKQWLPLARLLTQTEKNQSWREVKDEENQIRRATLDFARARFQHHTVAEAMRVLPQLNDLADAQRDPRVRKFEENKKMNDLRRGMFGDAIPELLPENEHEEAHPEIIEQRFQAARRRQNEQRQREYLQRQRQQQDLLKQQLARQAQNNAPVQADSNGPHADPRFNNDATDGSAPERGSATRSTPPPQGAKNPPSTTPATGAQSTAPQAQSTPPPEPAPEPFVDEPRKLTREERDREYQELMRRARHQKR